MSGIVNKVKEVLHKDKDNTDPAHSSHTGTTGHGTVNPVDRNNDGRVDAHDLTGQHGSTGAGLTGHNTTGHGTANPIDRNNDGRVNASDLTGQHGSAGAGLTGHNTAGHGTVNPIDRNNDGRVDARDVTGQHGTTGGLTGQHGATGGLTGQHGATGGLTGQHGATGGLAGQHGTAGGLTGHNTGAHGTVNPIDRNNDGRVDARDLTGQQAGVGGLTGHGTSGGIGSTAGAGYAGGNTVGHSTTGTHGHTANPIDRNNDGRIDGRDLTGQHAGAGGFAGQGTTGAGLTGGNIVGHSTTGTHGHTANPIDRNNDGRVDARDLTGQGHSTTGGLGGTTGGVGHGHQSGNLDHRPGESGDLPRALVEDKSRAQPHGFTEGHHNTTGAAGTTGTGTHGKPSLKDKLNPKVDADGDGKAGIMD